VSKIRWSRSHNAAADLIVHARTTSIHPPISAVHPEFDKPSTCGNASIRPATGTHCGPGTPAGSRKSPAARAGGQRAVRLLRYRATSSRPTPRACHGYPPDPDATLRSWLRHFGPRITTPVQKAGQSITRKCNAFGANKGFECHSRRHNGQGSTVIADAPELGVGGGLPVRRHHRWAADQDRPNCR
jgi:hypothetical protein